MAAVQEQISQLEAAIAAQAALRPTLGDAVVRVTIAALRAQIEALQGQPAEPERRDTELSPEELLAHLQSYLPRELAQKMQATGRIEGERKQVTVLFADISGFTALGERLDPEEVALLTNDALKELAEAVYQYEGYIDKFVGDAVMAVFGAPVAHEDDPERALRTALAMRERLEGFNRRWAERLGQPLELHIGANTGLVVAGNVGTDLRLSYTVMGDTVNTASRLVDAAQPGQILVSRGTYRLTQEAFTFLALEPIRVRGKREPLTVLELQRAKLHPGKSRGLQGLAARLVGREEEMAQLRGVLQELAAGRGRIVTITGEAGIGKSRLLAEWRAGQAGVRWLEGRAFAHTTALAYGPFLDLLRRLAGIRDEDSEAHARARLRGAVEQRFPHNEEAQALLANLLGMRLAPDEATVLARFPAESLRRRIFSLVEELLVGLATAQPTVLILEDTHWADATSLELVEHLLPLTDRLPVAIVGVFRRHTGEAPGALQALIVARYLDRCTSLTLAPLSQSDSLEMVEQLLATPELPEALGALILSKAEGNPFFVEEVIRSLIDRGALVRDDAGAGWVATPLIEQVTVPDTLQGLLTARLDRLPEETKWVVQQAAVIGRIFLYRVLLQIAQNAPGLDADLSHLEREELIREHARDPEVEYMFQHALTQEVAYQSLLAPRRKALHRRVGAAMEVLFAGRLEEFTSIVANHFWRGEAWEKGFDYLVRAGDAAARLYANAEARLHFAQALEAVSQLPDTIDNRRRQIDVTIKQCEVAWAAEPPAQHLERLIAAEAVARALPGPAGMTGGDPLRLARVLYWIGRFHYLLNAPQEAIAYYRQVMELAQELGDEELLAISSSVIGRAQVVQGRFGEAAPLLAQAIPLLEQQANWREWLTTVAYQGVSLAARGQYEAGLAEGERALAQARDTNNLSGVTLCQLYLFAIYSMGGDTAGMREATREAAEIAAQSGDHVALYVSCGYRAWAESRLGEHEAAMASMAQSRAIARSLGERLVVADWVAAAEAEIALAAGRLEEALTLAEATVSLARSMGGIYAEGLAHRTWAQALAALHPPCWEEVEAHLAASVKALEAGECHVEGGRTHLVWGRLCLERHHHTSARDHLEKAAAQFEASGLVRELELARQCQTRLCLEVSRSPYDRIR